MVRFYFIVLIPLITATRRFDGASYRSSIMEGGKPILRIYPNTGYAESNSDEGRQTTSPPNAKDPALVRDLGLLVDWLVENFSYDVVPLGRKNNDGIKESGKPILRMYPSDTNDSDSDEDDDKEAPKIEITEPLPTTEKSVVAPVKAHVEPSVETSVESENSDDALRTKHKKKITEEEEENSDEALKTKHKKKKTEEEEEPAVNPEWVKELKEFIKDLTTRYGKPEVLEHAKPVITSLEKKHNMKIKDIDGEIHITYVEKGKGKRKRKKSDET